MLRPPEVKIDYEPGVIAPEEILGTLRDIGYDLYDPRKLRPFEEEEADLVREGTRLLGAVAASMTAIALILQVSGIWSLLVPASVVALMVPVSYAILRPAGRARAALGAVGIIAPAALAYAGRELGLIGDLAAGWLTGALALVVVLGVALHILRMAFQAARRRILNQHVLLEVGAFAGIAGGIIGLTGVFPDYPTAPFFAVTVLVANYHIFSEWLSLLVKTRSSQAVRKLLDLQPDTARVVRDGVERYVPIAQVGVGDAVRVRPGERIPVDGQVAEGYSTVDLSLVTGEPVPAERGPGGEVIGGSINGSSRRPPGFPNTSKSLVSRLTSWEASLRVLVWMLQSWRSSWRISAGFEANRPSSRSSPRQGGFRRPRWNRSAPSPTPTAGLCCWVLTK